VSGASQAPTGRSLIHQACRLPMVRTGWKSRAPGWFTLPVAEGYLGVVAIGTASEHSARGEAEATAYVGIRDDATERIICRLCDMKDGGYQQRTAVSPIGYLMPGQRWRQWHVTSVTAAEVAVELTDAVNTCAVPFLRELAGDPLQLSEATQESAAIIQAPGRCRVAVLLARAGRVVEALAFVTESRDRADGQDAAWAVAERSWTGAFTCWVADNGGADL
jgi:hypothetical protein